MRWTLLLLTGVALGCSGLLAEATPFQGPAMGVKLTLDGGSTAFADAPRIEARFSAVGVTARAQGAAADRIELTLDGVDMTADLKPFFQRNVLEIRFAPDQVLTNAHIASAEVDVDEQLGRPFVAIRFTDEGKDRFCEWSGQHVRDKVSISTDGKVHSEPVIMEAICGGTAQITLGHDSTAPLAEGWALAASLAREPLKSDWTLAAIE